MRGAFTGSQGEIAMSKELNGTSRSLLKLSVLAAGVGLLIASGAGKAAAEASCPQWSTPVCRHWNLGPPPSCTEWACAADKKSDPPKVEGVTTIAPGNPQPNPTRFPVTITEPVKVGVGGATPVGPVGPRPPIVKPPVVTIGGINGGAGTTTTTTYAKRHFNTVVHHNAAVNLKGTFAGPIVRQLGYRQPAASHFNANAMAMHVGGGGGHGRH